MFDANARYLKKGTMFFAKSGDDLLYCEMLDDTHINPRVKIIHSYNSPDFYRGHIYQEKDGVFEFMPYEGYFDSGELHDFIHEEEKNKANAIIKRLEH